MGRVLEIFLASSLEQLRNGSLTAENFALLENDYNSTITKIRDGKFNKGLDTYLISLANHGTFDDIGNKIHFVNGSFNLETNNFLSLEDGGRTKEDMVTRCISYALEPVTLTEISETSVFNVLMKQTFPEENAWEYIRFLVGNSLCVKSVQDCEFLLLFGSGNNGKSTLLNLLRSVLEEGVYVQTHNHTVFDNDAEFTKSFRFVSPSVRFYLVEELSTKKKALSNLKMLCDGELFIRPLRGNDHVGIPIKGKLLTTSNDFIHFADGGINRRILYYHNRVKFVPVDTELQAGECHGSHLLSKAAIEQMSASTKSVIFIAFASMAVLYIRGERGDVEAKAQRPARPELFVV